MQVKTDIVLRYHEWERLDEIVGQNSKLGLFERYVDVFVVALSIGVNEDKIIEENKELNLVNPKSIPRNVLINNQDIFQSIEFLLQNAILNSKHIDADDEIKMKLAFDDDYETEGFKQWDFLIKFANYGINQILKALSDFDLLTIEKIIELIDNSVSSTIALEDDI